MDALRSRTARGLEEGGTASPLEDPSGLRQPLSGGSLDGTPQDEVEEEALLPKDKMQGHDHAYLAPPRGYVPRRFILVMMLFLGLFVAYMLRVCISVAAAPGPLGMYDALDWTKTQQGVVLGAFFDGYITTQIVGGILARRFGGKAVLGTGMIMACLCTALTPIVSHTFPLLVACRVAVGVFQAVTFPCVMTLLGVWCTPQERSASVGLVMAGSYTGTVVTYPLAAYLMETYSWQTMFFFLAGLGCTWAVCFLFICASTPALHSSIHRAELAKLSFAMDPQEEGDAPAGIPWVKILRCPSAWACFIGHFAFNWSFYTMLTELPSFLSLSLHFELREAGFVSMLPYIVQVVFSIGGGMLGDVIISRGILSRTHTRKAFMTVALLVPASCLVACGMATSSTTAVALMTTSIGISGLANTGVSANYLEISAGLSGIIMSVGNTVASLPGMVSPVLTGIILDHYACSPADPAACKAAYQLVFSIAFGVQAAGAGLFLLLASSDRVLF